MFVEDGREPAITEGAGSIAVELLRWPEPIATVVIPLGNGALLGGIGHVDQARVVRHEGRWRLRGSGAPAMRDSLRARRAVETAEARTIADGIAVRVPVPEALEYLAPVVDDVVLVSEGRASSGHGARARRNRPGGRAGGRRRHRRAHRAPFTPTSGLVATPLCGSNAL